LTAKATDLVQIEKTLRKRLSSASPDESSLAKTLRVQNARARRWVPRPFEDGVIDWRFLSDALHELYGSPRHGNPKDPLDCLIYVMLRRKTPIPMAGKLFGRLKRMFPNWGQMVSADVRRVRTNQRRRPRSDEGQASPESRPNSQGSVRHGFAAAIA